MDFELHIIYLCLMVGASLGISPLLRNNSCTHVSSIAPVPITSHHTPFLSNAHSRGSTFLQTIYTYTGQRIWKKFLHFQSLKLYLINYDIKLYISNLKLYIQSSKVCLWLSLPGRSWKSCRMSSAGCSNGVT